MCISKILLPRVFKDFSLSLPLPRNVQTYHAFCSDVPRVWVGCHTLGATHRGAVAPHMLFLATQYGCYVCRSPSLKTLLFVVLEDFLWILFKYFTHFGVWAPRLCPTNGVNRIQHAGTSTYVHKVRYISLKTVHKQVVPFHGNRVVVKEILPSGWLVCLSVFLYRFHRYSKGALVLILAGCQDVGPLNASEFDLHSWCVSHGQTKRATRSRPTILCISFSSTCFGF